MELAERHLKKEKTRPKKRREKKRSILLNNSQSNCTNNHSYSQRRAHKTRFLEKFPLETLILCLQQKRQMKKLFKYALLFRD